jgi:hypothetical protein
VVADFLEYETVDGPRGRGIDKTMPLNAMEPELLVLSTTSVLTPLLSPPRTSWTVWHCGWIIVALLTTTVPLSVMV